MTRLRHFSLFALVGLVACHDGALHDNQALLRSTDLTKSSAYASHACANDALTCTPTNVEGRIHHGGAMLGARGSRSYNLTMLAADDDILLDPSKGKGGKTFYNLRTSELYSGKIWLPAPQDWPDNPIVERVELNFDYLDVSFELAGTAIDGSYTVRFVMVDDGTAPDVNGTFVRGDKLLRRAGETDFSWCNLGSCALDRASVSNGLLFDPTLFHYKHPGEGNPHYAPYSLSILQPPTLTYAQASAKTNVWDFDIDVNEAIVFTAAPQTFVTVNDMVAAIGLIYAPGMGQSVPAQHQVHVDLNVGPLPVGL